MSAESDLATQFFPGDMQERDKTAAKRLKDAVLSLPFFTLIASCALIYTFDEWRPFYLVAVVVVTLLLTVTPLARYASIASRCILPLVLGRVCVEMYVLVQTLPLLSGLTKYLVLDNFYKEPFYTSVSTLYAIITALALVKSIEDFGAIKNNVASEAQKIQTILDLTSYFGPGNNEKTKSAIRDLKVHLRAYARNVARHRDKTANAVNVGLLAKCQQAIADIDTADENDQYALRKLIEERSSLAEQRLRRINSIGDTTPRYLLVALWLVAIALILPFFTVPLIDPADAAHLAVNPTRYTQYYMIFLMGSLNSYLLLMLYDINEPFDGFWVVDLQAFEELGKTPLAREYASPQTALS